MKKYEKVDVELVVLSVSDILTESVIDVDGDTPAIPTTPPTA